MLSNNQGVTVNGISEYLLIIQMLQNEICHWFYLKFVNFFTLIYLEALHDGATPLAAFFWVKIWICDSNLLLLEFAHSWRKYLIKTKFSGTEKSKFDTKLGEFGFIRQKQEKIKKVSNMKAFLSFS